MTSGSVSRRNPTHQLASDRVLLARYGVTDSELQFLERHFSGSSLLPQEYIAILMLTRGIRARDEQASSLPDERPTLLENLQAATESLLDAIKHARSQEGGVLSDGG
jgi:hypothetical protein